MITIEELELKANYPQRYGDLAIKYSDEANCQWVKPKKEDMLAIFKKCWYAVKYISNDGL
jgi:hypothetical protein